jgi:nucleoside-diphosphate-sugar epimerase
MRVFVAGATGALGRQLVPKLVADGHDVIGMTRNASKGDLLVSLGAEPVLADALDRTAVTEAVVASRPDAIINQVTALGGDLDVRNMARTFEMTNRLRTEGTEIMLAAAREAGVRRYIAQSFGASWPFAREGGPVKTETSPLDDDPPAGVEGIIDAIKTLERLVTTAEGIEGIVLRYGGFYGPGTSIGNPGGEQLEAVRERKLPVVGSGAGITSLIHIEDAAEATVRALDVATPGVYNIVDDDPAPAKEWIPGLAEAVGAKPPFRIPKWVGRLVAGPAATAMMTETRGASNAKAKRELDWSPRYSSWRQGFAEGLG